MPKRTDRALLRAAVAGVVEQPYATSLVAAYFDPSRGFAGAMFDGFDTQGLLADNPPARFVATDLAAVSLLDVRFGPPAVRRLLGSPEVNEALEAVPISVALWEADEHDIAAATRLWALIRGGGVGRTKASKLLSRKRPHLVPIVDSVIAGALHIEHDIWEPLAEVLEDDQLRRRIDALRPESVDIRISTLRLLDVATWMAHSRSESAVHVQRELNAPTARELARS